MLEHTSDDRQFYRVRIEKDGCGQRRCAVWLIAFYVAIVFSVFTAGGLGPNVFAENGAQQVHNSTSITQTHEQDDGPVFATQLVFTLAPSRWQQFFQWHLRMLHPGHAPAKRISAGEEQRWKKSRRYEYQQTWRMCGTIGSEKITSAPAIIQVDGNSRPATMVDSCKSYDAGDWRGKLHSGKVICQAGNRWCDPVLMWTVDSIRAKQYNFVAYVEWNWYSRSDNHNDPTTAVPIETEIDERDQELPFKITLLTMNAFYTKFEVLWKAFFSIVTVLIGLPFLGAIVHVNSSGTPLAHQHYWIGLMLYGLLFFDEPFLVLRILSSPSISSGLAICYAFTSTAFIAFMLFYWLVMLDDCRVTKSADVFVNVHHGQRGYALARLQRMQLGRGLSNRVPKRSLVMFYAPKFSLVLILWILLYASYMLLLTRRKGDPSYQIVDADEDGEFEDDGDASVWFFVAVFAMVANVLYVIWAAGLWLSVILVLKSVSKPFQWLFGLSSFTLLMTVIGLFCGIAYQVPLSAFSFIGFYGVLNAYVWVLALAWMPILTDEDDEAQLIHTRNQMELSSLDSKSRCMEESGEDDGVLHDVDITMSAGGVAEGN